MKHESKFLSALTLGLGGLALTAPPGFAELAVTPHSVPHTVYVESNIPQAGVNSILAYSAAGDGTLTPLPGSPFLTGGTGIVDSSFA